MENASKALLMAGGVLLTMLVISLLLYAWTAVSEYQANQDRLIEVQEVAEFNQQFTNYGRDDVQGYELLSLVNKVIDYNQRYSSEFDANKSAGNSAQYKPITTNITIYHKGKTDNDGDGFVSENELTKKLATTLKIPTSNGSDTEYPSEAKLQLFTSSTNGVYTQSDTDNRFKATVLDEKYDIEKYFGGIPTNVQNLVKSRGTIFEGDIIGYNGQPAEEDDRKNWYEESYIISRYKTLTGQQKSIDDIRCNNNYDKVLKYYEFMEFKKAEFKCTGITYDDDTGRVISINFEIKE